jgi:hypothetical protein
MVSASIISSMVMYMRACGKKTRDMEREFIIIQMVKSIEETTN